MCDQFSCTTRSIISAQTNFIQSRLHLAIIILTVKIPTNSNNLFGNPLYWTIFLLRKWIPTWIKIRRTCSQSFKCFPLNQVKVGSFGFSTPVSRDGCGSLLVSTDWRPVMTLVRGGTSNTKKSRWNRVGASKIILDFYPVIGLVRWIISRLASERLGEMWWKSLIISDNQDETSLIITINYTSIGDLSLIMTIIDTGKNQTKRLDSDNIYSDSTLSSYQGW